MGDAGHHCDRGVALPRGGLVPVRRALSLRRVRLRLPAARAERCSCGLAIRRARDHRHGDERPWRASVLDGSYLPSVGLSKVASRPRRERTIDPRLAADVYIPAQAPPLGGLADVEAGRVPELIGNGGAWELKAAGPDTFISDRIHAPLSPTLGDAIAQRTNPVSGHAASGTVDRKGL